MRHTTTDLVPPAGLWPLCQHAVRENLSRSQEMPERDSERSRVAGPVARAYFLAMISRTKKPSGPSRHRSVPFSLEPPAQAQARTKAPTPTDSEAQPLAATRTILIVSPDAATRQSLADRIRSRAHCRVLQASSIAEAQYLVAVEGNISLMLADSLSNQQIALARWFLTTQPGAIVLVAEQSLWKLTGAPGRCEQMLMAKSYTPDELASTVRGIVLHHPNGAWEASVPLKDAA
jgi:hypothetical protein